MADFVTDGNVASTTLFPNRVWDSATMYRFVDSHRFMTQHQLTLTSPVNITGKLSVRIIPDTGDMKLTQSVDSGLFLELNDQNSAVLLFSSVLRGIELVEVETFGLKKTMTIVLSSTRGQA
jgi:hypothetical protein